jgi:hypothetical protein
VKNRWGREETYRWPSGRPVWTIAALALTAVAVLATAGYEYSGAGSAVPGPPQVRLPQLCRGCKAGHHADDTLRFLLAQNESTVQNERPGR